MKGKRVRIISGYAYGQEGIVVNEYPGMFWAMEKGYVAHHIDVQTDKGLVSGLETNDVEVL